MKEKFRQLAEKFVEYLKKGDFSKNFDFVMNDGTNNFDFGTSVPHCGFGNWIFITSMYGDSSTASVSMFTIEDVNDIEDDWDNYVDMITEYYFTNYKDWNVVIN